MMALQLFIFLSIYIFAGNCQTIEPSTVQTTEFIDFTAGNDGIAITTAKFVDFPSGNNQTDINIDLNANKQAETHEITETALSNGTISGPTDGKEESATEMHVENGTSGATITESAHIVTTFKVTTTESADTTTMADYLESATYFQDENLQDFDKVFASIEIDEADKYESSTLGGEEATTANHFTKLLEILEKSDKSAEEPNVETENSVFALPAATTAINQNVDDGQEEINLSESDNFPITTEISQHLVADKEEVTTEMNENPKEFQSINRLDESTKSDLYTGDKATEVAEELTTTAQDQITTDGTTLSIDVEATTIPEVGTTDWQKFTTELDTKDEESFEFVTAEMSTTTKEEFETKINFVSLEETTPVSIEDLSFLLNKHNDTVREEFMSVILEEGKMKKVSTTDTTTTESQVSTEITSEMINEPRDVKQHTQIDALETTTDILTTQREEIVRNEKMLENRFSNDVEIRTTKNTQIDASETTTDILTTQKEEIVRNEKLLENRFSDDVEIRTTENTQIDASETTTDFLTTQREEFVKNEKMLENRFSDDVEIRTTESLETTTLTATIKELANKSSTFAETTKNSIFDKETPETTTLAINSESTEIQTSTFEITSTTTSEAVTVLANTLHSTTSATNRPTTMMNSPEKMNETEPRVLAQINGQMVSFTAKITKNNVNYFVPSDVFLSMNSSNKLNMTWKSAKSHLNNSIWFDLSNMVYHVVINLVKDNAIETYSSIFTSHSLPANDSTSEKETSLAIYFSPEVRVLFSNTDFLKLLVLAEAITETDAQTSSNQSRMLTAEIMGACLGFAVIIGLVVYFSIKLVRGKTRGFKPNVATV